MKEGPREQQLREMREARAKLARGPNPFEDAARGRDPAPAAKSGLRIASRPPEGPIGDGVALTNISHPPGLIDKLADAITSGKLSLKPTDMLLPGRYEVTGAPKRGRPRKPEAELSRSSRFRRKAEEKSRE